MFTHSREFWVNICAHTNSRASAPTQVLLIEWQSHYAKRLAPWDFLTNMHTHLVFLLCFFISLLCSLSPSQTHSVSFQTGYITRSLNLIIHKWALFHSHTHSHTQSCRCSASLLHCVPTKMQTTEHASIYSSAVSYGRSNKYSDK